MKKYARYVCTVCKRIADKLVDNNRVTPDTCTITLNCRGRLQLVEYRSDGQITPAAVAGVTDWYPRGESVTTEAGATSDVLIDTSTGTKKQLVVAVELSAPPAPTSTLSVSLAARSNTPKDFKQYIFRRNTGFTTISGIESGLAQKVLKFVAYGTNPDLVEVWLNGTKLEQGTGPDQYQLDDGTATTPAPSNTIKFNSLQSPVGVWQVDVFVSKELVLDTYDVVFNRNVGASSRLATGAWENISVVQRFDGTWKNFYLYTYDIADTVVLQKDTILFPSGLPLLDGVPVDLDKVNILLARSPYTKLDRYPDICVKMNTLGADRDYLKYVAVNGDLRLLVTQSSVSVNFPPAKLTKFNVEKTLKVQAAGMVDQVVVDGSLVVGPDV